MRQTLSLLVILALLATTQFVALDVRASSRAQGGSTTQAPQVTGVRLKGKKLWVVGENFSEGSEILINGEHVGTTSDPDDPDHILFAKKGGRRIPTGSLAKISVRSAVVTSSAFDFFAGLTIMLDDSGKSISLKAGEKFELLLKTTIYTWVIFDLDSSMVTKVNDPAAAGAQGIFQALKPGTTRLRAVGSLPCHKENPPCLAPSPVFEVTLVIE